MKKIVLTAGPIPARLDSVKVVTNKFKGGLAAKTASLLSRDRSFDVEVIKWRGATLDLPRWVDVRNVDDVTSYMDAVLSTEADAYVLAAAVANLMPVSPWEGKFPSHEYGPGDEFDIRFTIAPRIIDEVKKKYPRSTLIGYKLFDGTEEELVSAGFHTMRGSRANVVFCNHPATAKSEKVALTPDGARIRMNFDEHVDFIRRTVGLKWYGTLELGAPSDPDALSELERLLPMVSDRAFTKAELSFGTFAVRAKNGFATTTRGKRGRGLCQVFNVEQGSRKVASSERATMNAPTLWRLFQAHPDARYVLHAHKQLPNAPTHGYAFPGTTEEDAVPASRSFNVRHHGYYVALRDEEELHGWLNKHHP